MNDDLWCYTCFPNSVHAAHKEGKTMSKIVTDKPDPDCPICDGRGVVGGCWECRLVHAVGLRPEHMHTYSFCRCVNERTMEVTDDE